MITNEYSKSKNLKHTWVHWPCVRVSTAKIPSTCNGFTFGGFTETWIFSNCPLIKSRQVIYEHRRDEYVVKAHDHIVRNLRNKLKGATHASNITP